MHRTAHAPFLGLAVLLAAATGCSAGAPSQTGGGPAAPATVATIAAPTIAGPAAPPPTMTSAVRPSGPDVHAVDFRNMTYPADTCVLGGIAEPPAAGYPVHNGRWDGQAGEYIALERDVTYGDVTGDGQDEAVVTIACSTGIGTSTRTHPWVYTADAAAARTVRRLAFPTLTEAVLAQVGLPAESYTRGGPVSVANGALTIDWAVWTPSDPLNFPSRRVITQQRWSGSEWQATGRPSTHENTADR
jgi:hypothetical protein